MAVIVRDRMSMCCSAVGVCKSMLMLMRMIMRKCISSYKCCSDKHHKKSSQINHCQLFMQKYKRKKCGDKRSNCVIRTGFRSTEFFLSADISKDTIERTFFISSVFNLHIVSLYKHNFKNKSLIQLFSCDAISLCF